MTKRKIVIDRMNIPLPGLLGEKLARARGYNAFVRSDGGFSEVGSPEGDYKILVSESDSRDQAGNIRHLIDQHGRGSVINPSLIQGNSSYIEGVRLEYTVRNQIKIDRSQARSRRAA